MYANTLSEGLRQFPALFYSILLYFIADGDFILLSTGELLTALRQKLLPTSWLIYWMLSDGTADMLVFYGLSYLDNNTAILKLYIHETLNALSIQQFYFLMCNEQPHRVNSYLSFCIFTLTD